jgi:hypothetical protein
MSYVLYSIPDHDLITPNFLNTKKIVFKNIDTLLNEITLNDKSYNINISPYNKYIFFGKFKECEDCNVTQYITLFKNFIKEQYGINISEFTYMKNNNNIIYTIPKWCCYPIKMKEIHKYFQEKYDYIPIDMNIYNKMFILPDQTLGISNEVNNTTKYTIIIGNVIDFIINHIDKCYKMNSVLVIKKPISETESILVNKELEPIKQNIIQTETIEIIKLDTNITTINTLHHQNRFI